MTVRILIFLFVCAPISSVNAQLPVIDDQLELTFRFRVKQVNQFISRFNNKDQEFIDLHKEFRGIPPGRAEAIRRVIAPYVNAQLGDEFVKAVTTDSLSVLTLYDDNWYAHATGIVKYKGQEDTLKLSLRLYRDAENTFRWVIGGARADFLSIRREENGVFINPSSHETNFIGLKKVFAKGGNGSAFFDPNFEGDDLTLLSYAMAGKEIEFLGVIQLEFYFLQLPGWTFRITDHNGLYRGGGWLISDLEHMNDEEKKDFKRDHLYLNY